MCMYHIRYIGAQKKERKNTGKNHRYLAKYSSFFLSFSSNIYTLLCKSLKMTQNSNTTYTMRFHQRNIESHEGILIVTQFTIKTSNRKMLFIVCIRQCLLTSRRPVIGRAAASGQRVKTRSTYTRSCQRFIR